MKTLVFLLVLLGAVWVAGQSPQGLFSRFKHDHNKTYHNSVEENYRYGIFLDNLNRAEERNNHSDGAEHGVTKFMDLTPEEFQAEWMGFSATASNRNSPPTGGHTATATLSYVTPPAAPTRYRCNSTTTCNWATVGATTPVKDQASCGSCWAFSATEQIETAYFLAGHPLPSLGPQQYVDCDTTDLGCNGGATQNAYNYVIRAGGQESAADYPYTAVGGTCKFSTSKVAARISAWNYAIARCTSNTCNSQNEAGLWNIIQTSGPMSICINASPWQTYKSGIMTSGCANGYNNENHCAQLVGYGVSNGQKYWLVRNQWGTYWGESGYIRLAFGSNMCGLANEVTWVTAA
jgi:cathepsin F